MAKNIEKDPTIGMMMSDHTIGEAEEGGTDLQEDTIDLIALIEGTMIDPTTEMIAVEIMTITKKKVRMEQPHFLMKITF